MGFDPAVIALTPNSVVANSGNFSAPAPVKEWWELIWNAVAGLASAVWNAAVGVAMFFVALALWLVDAVVGLVIGLATGDWTYFQDKVVKPFVEAMMALIKFLIDLLKAVIDLALSILQPLLDAVAEWRSGAQGAFLREGQEQRTGGRTTEPYMTTNSLLGGAGMSLAFGLSAAITGLGVVVGVIGMVAGGLAAVALKMVEGMILNFLKAVAVATVKNLETILVATEAAGIIAAFIGIVDSVLPTSSEAVASWTPWVSLAAAAGIMLYRWVKTHSLTKALWSDPVGLTLSILGVLVGGVLGLVLTVVGFWWTWAIDDIWDKQVQVPKVATKLEEIVATVDMGATFWQFIEDLGTGTP